MKLLTKALWNGRAVAADRSIRGQVWAAVFRQVDSCVYWVAYRAVDMQVTQHVEDEIGDIK